MHWADQRKQKRAGRRFCLLPECSGPEYPPQFVLFYRKTAIVYNSYETSGKGSAPTHFLSRLERARFSRTQPPPPSPTAAAAVADNRRLRRSPPPLLPARLLWSRPPPQAPFPALIGRRLQELLELELQPRTAPTPSPAAHRSHSSCRSPLPSAAVHRRAAPSPLVPFLLFSFPRSEVWSPEFIGLAILRMHWSSSRPSLFHLLQMHWSDRRPSLCSFSL